MLLFPMNVLLEHLMFIKLILVKVTTQKQEDELWTMGEECVFSLHTHYLGFIIQWKHDFFCPVSLILFLPGNNFSFSPAPLARNKRVLPYNGEIALSEQNINKKDPCPAVCNSLLSTLIDNKQPTPGIWRAEQVHLSNCMVVVATTPRTALFKHCFSPVENISEHAVWDSS